MKKAIFPLALAISLAIGILLGCLLTRNAATQYLLTSKRTNKEAGNKLTELLEILDESYVDSLNMDSIAESIVPTLMQQLDPHSSYISAEQLQAVNDELSASFVGIGIQFNMLNDTIYVVSVVKDGPCEKAGVLPDDKILKADTVNLAGQKLSTDKVIKTLKGTRGSRVELTIQRPYVDSLLHFTIQRDEIPVKSVDVAYMITPEIGYISVNKFGENTYVEFLTALASLKKQNAKKLIIDLRGNTGGFLEAAVNMLNELVADNTLLVYMEGAKHDRRDWISNGSGSSKNLKLIVLIDEFSASASEIFAGAIQDNDRGLIIGRRSFGKGLVQQQFPFRDGSAVRMTIARYYTPSGRCIQKPYTLGHNEDYEADIYNRYLHGEFFHADSIRQNDSTVYKTAGGRTVYGGGGIMPDIFVPRDTSDFTNFFRESANKSLPYKFGIQYTAKHRKELTAIKDWKAMEAYLLKKGVMNEFLTYCNENGLPTNNKEYLKSKKLFEQQVIGYIIRNILNDEGYFPYFNKNDETVNKAVELFRK